MVGAEWRKASRVFEAYMEKLKAGVHFTNEGSAAVMFEAWEHLPLAFREKMERRLWDKQYGPVREQAERDIEAKTRSYEARIKEFREAELSYRKSITEAQNEQAKLENAKTAIKQAEAFRAFLKAMGVEQNIKWWNVTES